MIKQTCEPIITALSEYEAKTLREANTQLMSRGENTPLHYEPSFNLPQTNKLNKMLANAVMSEFVARAEPEKAADAAKVTGFNYATCYTPLHTTLAALRAGNPQALEDLASIIFKDKKDLDLFNYILAESEIVQEAKIPPRQAPKIDASSLQEYLNF